MRKLFVGSLVLTLAAGACANASETKNGKIGDVILIRAAELGNAYPAALGQGHLVVEHGCLALATEAGRPSFILWPPTFDLQRGQAGIEVLDGEDNLVAGVGEPIQLGGGWMHLAPAQDVTAGRIPPACQTTGERYFIASPGIEWELDGVTLLRHRGDTLSGDQALTEGVLGERNGCVALLDSEGGGPYLVWPRRYILTGGPNMFWVHDRADEVVAAWGDRLSLGGGIGAILDPPSLPGGIPEACQEPGEAYWYVGEVQVLP